MKTTTKLLKTIPFLLAAAALFYGCKEDAFDNDDNDIVTGYTYHIKTEIGAAQGDAAANGKARSLTLDSNSVVHSTWEAGDQLIAYNNSDRNRSAQTAYSLLNVAQAGIGTQHSAFEGTIVSRQPVSTNDLLCFLYPGGASTDSTPTITPVIRSQSHRYDTASRIKKTVLLDLTHQDGTVATIGKKFDYQWAAVYPQSVNGNDVQCTVGHLQREIAIWAINVGRNVDSLTITNMKWSDVFDLSTGDFVGYNNLQQYTITLRHPISDKNGYIYIAVLPGSYADVVVTAYTFLPNSDLGVMTQERVVRAITFEKDKIYRSAAIFNTHNSTKQYVQVQGVKWAKGNFIYYRDTTYANAPEYWGIAPGQAYLSGTRPWGFGSNMMDQPTARQWGIFFAGQNENENDLFRCGDIRRANTISSYSAYCILYDYHTAGSNTIHISKTLFTNQSATVITTDSAQAACGDLVWLHTRNRHQKYRLPSDAEMHVLFEEANVRPGFCRTNLGRIYGWYFWTNRGTANERVQRSPTTVNSWSEYEDVTNAVRLDAGLFLPYTGLVVGGTGSTIDSTCMLNSPRNATGCYWTDYLDQSNFNYVSFNTGNYVSFNPGYSYIWESVFAASNQRKAVAIRPVWDETSDDIDDYIPGAPDFYLLDHLNY